MAWKSSDIYILMDYKDKYQRCIHKYDSSGRLDRSTRIDYKTRLIGFGMFGVNSHREIKLFSLKYGRIYVHASDDDSTVEQLAKDSELSTSQKVLDFCIDSKGIIYAVEKDKGCTPTRYTLTVWGQDGTRFGTVIELKQFKEPSFSDPRTLLALHEDRLLMINTGNQMVTFDVAHFQGNEIVPQIAWCSDPRPGDKDLAECYSGVKPVWTVSDINGPTHVAVTPEGDILLRTANGLRMLRDDGTTTPVPFDTRLGTNFIFAVNKETGDIAFATKDTKLLYIYFKDNSSKFNRSKISNRKYPIAIAWKTSDIYILLGYREEGVDDPRRCIRKYDSSGRLNRSLRIADHTEYICFGMSGDDSLSDIKQFCLMYGRILVHASDDDSIVEHFAKDSEISGSREVLDFCIDFKGIIYAIEQDEGCTPPRYTLTVWRPDGTRLGTAIELKQFEEPSFFDPCTLLALHEDRLLVINTGNQIVSFDVAHFQGNEIVPQIPWCSDPRRVDKDLTECDSSKNPLWTVSDIKRPNHVAVTPEGDILLQTADGPRMLRADGTATPVPFDTRLGDDIIFAVNKETGDIAFATKDTKLFIIYSKNNLSRTSKTKIKTPIDIAWNSPYVYILVEKSEYMGLSVRMIHKYDSSGLQHESIPINDDARRIRFGMFGVNSPRKIKLFSLTNYQIYVHSSEETSQPQQFAKDFELSTSREVLDFCIDSKGIIYAIEVDLGCTPWRYTLTVWGQDGTRLGTVIELKKKRDFYFLDGCLDLHDDRFLVITNEECGQIMAFDVGGLNMTCTTGPMLCSPSNFSPSIFFQASP